MRIFEVLGYEQGDQLASFRSWLAVKQGEANKPGQQRSSEIPWEVSKGFLDSSGISAGISTPDGLRAIKDMIDPAGDVIQDIKDNGTIVLNTNIKNPNDDEPAKQGGRKSIDQMASHAAKHKSFPNT